MVKKEKIDDNQFIKSKLYLIIKLKQYFHLQFISRVIWYSSKPFFSTDNYAIGNNEFKLRKRKTKFF